ncbi:TPA: hypothetical protein DCW61_03315 [Candidatus Uhrbacteria bacterium]|nr:hypothetical protein [Candidatus Uhrbacteria bacterium]
MYVGKLSNTIRSYASLASGDKSFLQIIFISLFWFCEYHNPTVLDITIPSPFKGTTQKSKENKKSNFGN